GLQHRRPAADLAGGPLGQADAAGDSLETYVVTVAVLVLIGPGGGVRPGDHARGHSRAGTFTAAARGRPRWPRTHGRLALIEHGALRADRAVGREAVVAAEEGVH